MFSVLQNPPSSQLQLENPLSAAERDIRSDEINSPDANLLNISSNQFIHQSIKCIHVNLFGYTSVSLSEHLTCFLENNTHDNPSQYNYQILSPNNMQNHMNSDKAPNFLPVQLFFPETATGPKNFQPALVSSPLFKENSRNPLNPMIHRQKPTRKESRFVSKFFPFSDPPNGLTHPLCVTADSLLVSRGDKTGLSFHLFSHSELLHASPDANNMRLPLQRRNFSTKLRVLIVLFLVCELCVFSSSFKNGSFFLFVQAEKMVCLRRLFGEKEI